MGPLSGVKVLDFSTLLPGPYASMILADMGAQVLRIESPDRPDLMRITPPLADEDSYAHKSVNRNKRSLALDLKTAQATEIIYQLVEHYDVVIEQFRPGVMQRLGLDYERLKAYNEKLIYCSITGYGQSGPLCQKAGHDINYLALSGLASYGGEPAGKPTLSATQIADIAGGSHHAVMGILAAYISAQSSGHGQHLDISMSDAAFALNGMYGAIGLATQSPPKPAAEMLNGGGIYDYYPTEDGRYLSVGALEPKFAQAFFSALGYPQWIVRFSENNLKGLKDDIAKVIIGKPMLHWQRCFESLDACVEPVLDLMEAAQQEHFISRQMTQTVDLPDGSKVQQVAPPIKFSEGINTPIAGAKLGEHSVEVLAELGLEHYQITQLVKDGVVCSN